jgi:hypothetical protein
LQYAGVGQLVASKFHDVWYRAAIVKNKNNADVRVFYVDYGDVEKKKMSEVFNLNPAFQELKHQAICCSLDGVDKM